MGQSSGTAVSLLFPAGRRPGAEAIRQLARESGHFSISIDPEGEFAAGGDVRSPAEGQWLELLTNGLTFDLVGLSPGAGAEQPPRGHFYALPPDPQPFGVEALTVRPGPHLAGGQMMAPILRTLASLAASLTSLDGVEAVAWHTARTWCGPGYFRESVLRWIGGGVFPSLGLTALAVSPDGGMHSEGLAAFIGQEVRLEPELTSDKAAGAKIGVRLIDVLVEHGRVEGPQQMSGPEGQALRLEPSANGHFVRVWQG